MIKAIDLINFRSYSKFSLKFTDKLTIIYGPNAIGKTNLLEAIFLSGVGRSFRSKDRHLIRHRQKFFYLSSQFDNLKVEISLINNQDEAKKSLKINGVYKPLSRLVGLNPVSLFKPSDINLLLLSPENKRRYIDSVLSQADFSYAQNLLNFKHLLAQRNKLLSTIQKANYSYTEIADQLFVWNLQIVEPIEMIVKSRQNLIDKLNIIISRYYQNISGDKAKIKLQYRPTILANSKEILAKLESNLPNDLKAGFSCLGPHRDDLIITLNGKEVDKVASRGEIRTTVLALKLAEMDLIETCNKKRPILLLDDVFSELDSNRQNYLLDLLAGQQTIITTTSIDNYKINKAQLIDLAKQIKPNG